MINDKLRALDLEVLLSSGGCAGYAGYCGRDGSGSAWHGGCSRLACCGHLHKVTQQLCKGKIWKEAQWSTLASVKNLLMDYRIFGTEASDCECRACGSCGREYLVHQGNSPSDTMANWRNTRHHGISSAKRVVKSMRLQPFKRLPAKSSLPWEKVIGEERHSHWALDPWDG